MNNIFLKHKYLDMYYDENMNADDIIEKIFNDCKVEIKISEEYFELLEKIQTKKYGQAKHCSKSLDSFIGSMATIDADFELMSLDDLKKEYKKLKKKD